nr:hypothetical protein [Tanacetum cinerariifolium]
MGKSKKKLHKPISEDTNQEKLYLLHMDLCGPMRIASVNGKKYILVILDDYSQFTWVKFLASKDEAPDFIIKFMETIQIRLNANVRNIRTDNGTKFFNQTLRDYYEQLALPLVPVEEALALIELTGSPSLTTIDQDAPSPSTSQTTPQSQSQIIPLCTEEESHDLEVAHMSNDPYFGISFPETISKESSSLDVIPTTVHSDAPISEHLIKPKTYKDILTQSCWIEAMQEELHEVERLEVWELVLRLDKVMVIALKWIYKEEGIDFKESFAPVVRQEVVRILLAFAAHMNMTIYQMDVKMTFLNRILHEEVYVSQPDRFLDLENPNHVYRLKKALFLLSQGFSKGMVDPTLFISRKGKDILLISQTPRFILLNQSKYALESLKKYKMVSCDLVDTLMVEKSKLDEDTQGKAVDPTHYRGMVGTLMYLTSSIPDMDTRRSTSGSMQLLGDRLVSWSSKRQKSAAISCMKSEYISLSGCYAQVLWMRSQLTDYGLRINKILININPIATQQAALDNALVPSEKRLKIERCNARIAFNKPPREETYQICPRINNQYFIAPPSEEELVTFIQELDYFGKCNMSLQFIIIKCTSLGEHLMQSLIGAFLGKQQDSIDSGNHELKSCGDKTISMRNKIKLHIIHDDSLLRTLKFVSKTQDYLQYGALIPDDLINQYIKDSQAYKTYYDFSTGKVPPGKARKYKKVASPSRKLSPVKEAKPVKKAKRVKRPAKKSTIVPTIALSEAAQLKEATKRSKKDFHISQANGSGDGTDFESRVLDEQQLKTSGTDEGIGDSEDDNDDINDDDDDDENTNDDDNANDDDSKGDDDKADSDDDRNSDADNNKKTDSDDDDDENPSFSLKDYDEKEHDEEYEYDDDNENVFEEEDHDLYKDVHVRLLGAEHEKERTALEAYTKDFEKKAQEEMKLYVDPT